MRKTIFLTIIFIFFGTPLNAQGVVPLNGIPDGITDPYDRATLIDWASRLDNYRIGYENIAETFLGECSGQPARVREAYNCAFRYGQLQDQQTKYNTDARTYNYAVKFALSAASHRARPLTNSEERQKVDIMLKALYEGEGDWVYSLAYLNDYVARNPGNRPARAALSYLESLSNCVLLERCEDQ